MKVAEVPIGNTHKDDNYVAGFFCTLFESHLRDQFIHPKMSACGSLSPRVDTFFDLLPLLKAGGLNRFFVRVKKHVKSSAKRSTREAREKIWILGSYTRRNQK